VSSVIRTQDTFRTCAVCHRTLLLGEHASRFNPGRSGDGWVDVCALCTDVANEHGWLREGTPTTPLVEEAPRRRRGFRFRELVHQHRPEPEPVFDEPLLRRLSEPEQAMVEAADVFNESAYRRTIAGIAKSLGPARVSFLPLSGTNAEMVLTVAWDISWYQYRVFFDSQQPVRLAERGYELEELDTRFQRWNGHLEHDGRVAPDIPRV
jgi:hypothetical protein